MENFRPGTLERLGFGSREMLELNERLIYCSISGYGTTGPRRDLSGYDMVIQGESGLMDVTGFPETGPTKVGVAITDCLAALYAVQGILLAHVARSRTSGCRYDNSNVDRSACFCTNGYRFPMCDPMADEPPLCCANPPAAGAAIKSVSNSRLVISCPISELQLGAELQDARAAGRSDTSKRTRAGDHCAGVVEIHVVEDV